MDKSAKLSGQNGPKPTSRPHPQPEPAQPESLSTPPYRIICNSEHFIVLNPVRRTKPNPPYRPDEGHADPAAPSKQFQAAVNATRQKGILLPPSNHLQ